MRVDWAIPCRYAETTPSGATIVGAGADVIVLPQLPPAVQILFAVRFVGAPDELEDERPHPVVCRIFDPEGNALGRQDVSLAAGQLVPIVPGFAVELTIPIGLVIPVRSFGTYSVEFEIDGDVYRRVPIHVVEAQSPAPE